MMSRCANVAVHADLWWQVSFVLSSLKHTSSHALVLLSCAVHCVPDVMQHRYVTALECCMQHGVVLRQRCSACRPMAV